MPNVRSQRVYNDGSGMALEIVASDGRTFTLTKAEVQTFWQSTTGNAASRRSQVITWLKNEIVTALGAEQIDILDLDYDFDTADGGITRAIIGRSV
jgi:hypothetical protein